MTGPGTAAISFLMMTALMAPRTLSCVDLEDFGFIPDSPGTPAVLAEASWHKETKELVWASEEDREIVRASAHVTALPLLGSWGK